MAPADPPGCRDRDGGIAIGGVLPAIHTDRGTATDGELLGDVDQPTAYIGVNRSVILNLEAGIVQDFQDKVRERDVSRVGVDQTVDPGDFHILSREHLGARLGQRDRGILFLSDALDLQASLRRFIGERKVVRSNADAGQSQCGRRTFDRAARDVQVVRRRIRLDHKLRRAICWCRRVHLKRAIQGCRIGTGNLDSLAFNQSDGVTGRDRDQCGVGRIRRGTGNGRRKINLSAIGHIVASRGNVDLERLGGID